MIPILGKLYAAQVGTRNYEMKEFGEILVESGKTRNCASEGLILETLRQQESVVLSWRFLGRQPF